MHDKDQDNSIGGLNAHGSGSECNSVLEVLNVYNYLFGLLFCDLYCLYKMKGAT